MSMGDFNLKFKLYYFKMFSVHNRYIRLHENITLKVLFILINLYWMQDKIWINSRIETK